ncbi:MAG: anti-sigma F factor [Clostridia bacterium]|nr:anti-sigma F factor [Clostridia bacterium]
MRKRREIKNEIRWQMPSLSVNEGLARAMVAAFCAQVKPTATEIADIKCAVSEAVTNCTVHAYRDTVGEIRITARLLGDGNGGTSVEVEIKDKGCGIPDVACARQPLYTTDAEGERSGMGFTVMESFCDGVNVSSRIGRGTTVTLLKRLHK